MDRVTEYRQIVCQFLENFAKIDDNAQLIFDRDRDRYLIMHNEWRNDYRIYGCAIQLDIIEEQIWIQHNSTEIYVDRELIQLGIDPKDIVLGFRSPSIRQCLAELSA
ncbi:MAG: XisI protein [Cyanobacteria bacterium SBLK]|nr:XisI protein [Cyanobacteria bacterium SBLK]